MPQPVEYVRALITNVPNFEALEDVQIDKGVTASLGVRESLENIRVIAALR